MAWIRIDKPGQYKGILVEGDPDLPKPRWWSGRVPGYRCAQEFVTFEVSTPYPFCVGYVDVQGVAYLYHKTFNQAGSWWGYVLQVVGLAGLARYHSFNVEVGRESRMYFALDEHGYPIPLRLVRRESWAMRTDHDGFSL